MQVTSTQHITIELKLKVDPGEAETLRMFLMRALKAETLRADEREIIASIVDGIGRVF